jgi:hypothetical protein
MAFCADALFGKISAPNIIVPFSLVANLSLEDRAEHADFFFRGVMFPYSGHATRR